MSTWRPPWSAQGQFAATLLPPTRASNSVTARPPPRPGSTAALRAGSQDPDTRDLPADLAGPAADHASAPVGRALPGHAQPAQPNHRTQHHTRKDPGRRQPTRGDHSDPDRRVWRGREAFALLGWGTMRAWRCRCAMADAVPPVPDRWCAHSAKPEPAPRMAAPPSSPGTTPLGAARCTKGGPAEGDSAAHPP